MIPLHVPLGEYRAACLAGYVSACMHACICDHPTPFVPVHAHAESVQPVQDEGMRK